MLVTLCLGYLLTLNYPKKGMPKVPTSFFQWLERWMGGEFRSRLISLLSLRDSDFICMADGCFEQSLVGKMRKFYNEGKWLFGKFGQSICHETHPGWRLSYWKGKVAAMTSPLSLSFPPHWFFNLFEIATSARFFQPPFHVLLAPLDQLNDHRSLALSQS